MKCPVSGVKICVQYVTLTSFYYAGTDTYCCVVSGMYCGGSEFKCPVSVGKSKPTELESPYTYEAVCVTLTFRSNNFQMSQHVKLFKTQYCAMNCVKLGFLHQNSGTVNDTKQKLSVLLPLVFISTGNCNDSYEYLNTYEYYEYFFCVLQKCR